MGITALCVSEEKYQQVKRMLASRSEASAAPASPFHRRVVTAAGLGTWGLRGRLDKSAKYLVIAAILNDCISLICAISTQEI